MTSLTIVYSSVYSGADQRKQQSSVLLAFVRGIHRCPVSSPHKGPVTRKMFPFDDVILCMHKTWIPACLVTDGGVWLFARYMFLNYQLTGPLETWLSFWKWHLQSISIKMSWDVFLNVLSHLPLDKMDAILRTPFSNAFSWKKKLDISLKIHWSLFLSVLIWFTDAYMPHVWCVCVCAWGGVGGSWTNSGTNGRVVGYWRPFLSLPYTYRFLDVTHFKNKKEDIKLNDDSM